MSPEMPVGSFVERMTRAFSKGISNGELTHSHIQSAFNRLYY